MKQNTKKYLNQKASNTIWLQKVPNTHMSIRLRNILPHSTYILMQHFRNIPVTVMQYVTWSQLLFEARNMLHYYPVDESHNIVLKILLLYTKSISPWQIQLSNHNLNNRLFVKYKFYMVMSRIFVNKETEFLFIKSYDPTLIYNRDSEDSSTFPH